MIQVVHAVDMTFARSCFYEPVERLSCIQDGYISTEHQVPDVSAVEIMKCNIIPKRSSGGVRQRANDTWRTRFLPVVVVCRVVSVDETLGHHRTVLVETSHHVIVASDCDATACASVTQCRWFISIVISRATMRGAHLIYVEKKDHRSAMIAVTPSELEEICNLNTDNRNDIRHDRIGCPTQPPARGGVPRED